MLAWGMAKEARATDSAEKKVIAGVGVIMKTHAHAFHKRLLERTGRSFSITRYSITKSNFRYFYHAVIVLFCEGSCWLGGNCWVWW
ncbi:hypothetical protein HanIR_Chr13g0637221 [Helianthus annuus]|nr:hypothetical protein HanIR_Chr13g0637221 [Helianthus annuus]